MPPFVDIILLNHNAARHTIECLETVMRLSYPAFRVIVCDNASTDGSVAEIRRWLSGERSPASIDDMPSQLRPLLKASRPSPITFVEMRVDDDSTSTDGASVVLLHVGKNAGFAAGNNAGLRLSLAEGCARFMWLLNNDTVVAPDSLDQLVAVAQGDERIGAVGATLLEYFDPDVLQMACGATTSETTGKLLRINQRGRSRSHVDASSTDFNFVCGCSLFVRRDALLDVGLLDDRFFIYAEDADFSLRLHAAGWRLGYAANALVWHKGSMTTVRGTPFNDYHNVRSSLLFVHKRRPSRVPLALAYWIYRALFPKLVRGQWHRFLAVSRAMNDVMKEVRARAHSL